MLRASSNHDIGFVHNYCKKKRLGRDIFDVLFLEVMSRDELIRVENGKSVFLQILTKIMRTDK